LTVDIELARLLRVGVKLLEREDLEGVVDGLDQMKFESVYDLSVLSLGYEIATEARLLAERSNSRAAGGKLVGIQATIMPRLLILEALKGGGLRKRSPG
jgi:hypothetical protein